VTVTVAVVVLSAGIVVGETEMKAGLGSAGVENVTVTVSASVIPSAVSTASYVTVSAVRSVTVNVFVGVPDEPGAWLNPVLPGAVVVPVSIFRFTVELPDTGRRSTSVLGIARPCASNSFCGHLDRIELGLTADEGVLAFRRALHTIPARPRPSFGARYPVKG
jgi:hypothetical protein